MTDAIKTRITAREYIETYPETMLPMALVRGVVIRFPTPKALHQRVVGNLLYLLAPMTKHLGRLVLSPSDVHFDEYTVLQPDLFFVAATNTRCRVADNGYWHGPPDLCIEILSESTAKHDRVTKFDLYARYGVREYWIVDSRDRFIEVYVLDDDAFKRQGAYDETQVFASPLLPDLKIKVAEVFPSPESA